MRRLRLRWRGKRPRRIRKHPAVKVLKVRQNCQTLSHPHPRTHEGPATGERRIGELLLATERAKGTAGTGSNQHKKKQRQSHDVTAAQPTLAEIGITKRESAEAQKLATMSQPAEDQETEPARGPTARGADPRRPARWDRRPPNRLFVLLNTPIRAELCHCRFFPLGKNQLQCVANKSIRTSKPIFRQPMSGG